MSVGRRRQAPGQEGDPAYGHYWNVDTKQWLSAPVCYAVWRNLTMTTPLQANAGQAVTVTATPNEGLELGRVRAIDEADHLDVPR